ncbi:hypothetical protein MUB18_06560 [Sphingobacterium sp. PCS056]|jgi:hypothetical protein|uniref:hypothetical protein n=1 Tax=Sphingobacterium TaxID=28453 RepID=UPI00097EF4EB|nr:hypothetical protein [Sphingobacterium sp. PCS056]UPZ37958.1 hypothetical protein MUB18_06560 [Sphingobacterium sp. PCS056]SJN51102.1 hypothetical protein FM120_28955 [Sphingobacterium faecium PCAi_F2.5]HCU44916.1 hypothetical protein [Sphingobacterium sp.]
MKKLEKLNSKKIKQTETIQGGAGIFVDFSLDDSGSVPTTEHRPTKGKLKEHYSCDHSPDVN